MPYELSFANPLRAIAKDSYINDCCVGGDVVAEALIPGLRSRYGELSPVEEDWGWFLWFEHSDSKLAVDIFCDEPNTGKFRIHLTSRIRRLFGSRVLDTPELETLKRLVVNAITAWVGSAPQVLKLDVKYMPMDGA